MSTGLKPPCSSVSHSTVPTVLVIVPIRGGESHTVMIRKLIVSVTRIESDKQGIVGCLICHRKIAIFCVSISSQCGVDFHSQLTRDLSQLMNLFVSKPKFPFDVTKPVRVLVPVPVESNEPIKAFVKDGPSTTIRRQYTSKLVLFAGLTVYTPLSLKPVARSSVQSRAREKTQESFSKKRIP